MNAPEPKCNPDDHWPTNEDCTGRTALIAASWSGHPDVVQTLLAAGANVNARNDDGRTALAIASERGHLEVVQALLAARSEVNARNGGGRTALALASEQGHLQVVQALIAAKADLNTTVPGETAGTYDTPLAGCCMEGAHRDCQGLGRCRR